MNLTTLLVLLALAFVAERDEGYVNEENGFALDPPPGWTTTEQDDAKSFRLVLRPEGNPGTLQAEVQVFAAKEGGTPESQLEATLEFVAKGEAYSEVEELRMRVAGLSLIHI